MATITDPESSNILDQLARVRTQLTNKAATAAVSSDASDIRSDLSDLSNELTGLINRTVDANTTLLDLEARVTTLESA